MEVLVENELINPFHSLARNVKMEKKGNKPLNIEITKISPAYRTQGHDIIL